MTSISAPDSFAHLTGLTVAASEFASGLAFEQIPVETLRIARRCILDGLAVALAGSEQEGMAPLLAYIRKLGGTSDARLLGLKGNKVPTHLAALWFGTAGHAMDWDDTQLAELPGRPFGLLMHPTMPPLVAALTIAQMVQRETGQAIDGKRFITAFCAGSEVGCKIAEAIHSDHYMRGFHTSGTIGTFAATAAAANMLCFNSDQTARAFGLAASMASGIRANFGTMAKPFHVGRASENGVTAALLAREDFTANTEALDGQWGYLAIAGRGGDPALVRDRFGAPFTMETPGISIKPFPSGVLTHPSMDAMLVLMNEEKLLPTDVKKITLFAGSNVLGPIRFKVARTALEGKFSLQFLLSAIILRGKAGKAEFTDSFVSSKECQAMQTRIETRFDPAIEKMGWECIRSRISVTTHDGLTVEKWADERYRGGPHKALSDRELERKFADCADGLLSDSVQQRFFSHIWAIERLPDATILIDDLEWKHS
jgi:2-methylcitrate dehydratase PrpD